MAIERAPTAGGGWGLSVGDIVHSLRAALDYLAWQLVILNGREPNSGTYFPVGPIKTPTTAQAIKDRKTMREGQAKAFGTAAMAIIESLQPNAAGNALTNLELHPLFLLHQLDIWDKHRRLHIVGGVVQLSGLSVGGPGENVHIDEMVVGGGGEHIRRVPIADGTELLRLRLGDSTSNVKVEDKFSGFVAFEQEGPGKGQPVLETLDKLINFVDQAITLFAPLFDGPKGQVPRVADALAPEFARSHLPLSDPPTEEELRAVGLDPDFEIRPPGAPPRFPKTGAPD
jgi:hypothetical protein